MLGALTLGSYIVALQPIDNFFLSFFPRYLTGKINEGEAHNITCPGFNCTKLVPVDVIETLVPRDIARRYLQFDIKVNNFGSVREVYLSEK